MADMFSNTTIPVLEQLVGFSQARHNVLAGNIANMDTPGYRVRDLSPEMFQSNLKQAIESGRRGGEGLSTSQSSATSRHALDKVRESMKSILYHDGSDDGLEQQVAEISKNQLQHNLAISILTSQFRLLQAAISERA